MKQCSKCKKTKDLNFFQKRSKSKDGLTAQCKECLREYDKKREQTEHRKEWCRNREKKPHIKEKRKIWRKTEKGRAYGLRHLRSMRKRYPEKNLARRKIRDAIRNKTLIRPEKCSICAVVCIPHGHHEDYSKPLDVVWVCRKCHNEIHKTILS